MLRPIARCTLTLAALGLALAVAAPARAQGAATPQAALDGLNAAIKAADAKAAMTFLTPAGQKLLAKDMVINGLAFLQFMNPDDPMGEKATGAELAKRQKAYTAAKAAITAAMKPSGLDAAIGKPLMPAEKIVDEKLPGADPVTLVPAIFEAAKKAGPELGMKDTPRLMKFG